MVSKFLIKSQIRETDQLILHLFYFGKKDEPRKHKIVSHIYTGLYCRGKRK